MNDGHTVSDAVARVEVMVTNVSQARVSQARVSQARFSQAQARRIALGAQRPQILSRVLRDGLSPAVFGLVLGLVASLGLTRLIASELFGTQPLDPMVLGLVSAVLLAVAVAACLLPAWRASRLDPMQALRME